ncbi:MAG: hypothetical protein HEP70_13810 [Rhodobiaceae bacterium]|nr:hypothetical protein [Rhodobiaceae bacterium]
MPRFKFNLSVVTALTLMVAPATSYADTVYQAVPDQAQIEQQTIEAAESALGETESLATAISFAFDYLTTFVSEAHPPDFLIHAEMKATTERLDGVRSILLINTDGSLMHDAFSYPAPNINLGERDYVQNALNQSGLVFGKAVIGQTSGVPFVPVSSQKPAMSAVLTAIVDPRKMREPLNWCGGSCGGALLTNRGEVITSSPPNAPIAPEVIETILAAEQNTGTFEYERPNFKALVAFRKSERFPVIVYTSHAVTPDGVLATQ